MASAGSSDGVPPPEVDGLERRPRRPELGVERVGPQRELDRQRLEEGGDPRPRSARRRAGHDDEVAVRTERDAERDVDVERDRRRRSPATISDPATETPETR